MKEEQIKIVKWSEEGMQQFKGFIQEMFGEHGKVKFDDDMCEHCEEISISQATGENAKVEAKFILD